MKKRTLAVLIIVAIGIILFLLRNRNDVSGGSVIKDSSAKNEVAESNLTEKQLRESASNPNDNLLSNAAALLSNRIEQRKTGSEKDLSEWLMPIEFYGLVLDENSVPVPDATIRFGCNDLSAEGHTDYNEQSDSKGLFFLQNVRGKFLSVQVSKAGYYTYKSNPYGFMYAGENVNFVPNSVQPIVFRLRKHGKAEPLIAHSGRLKLPLDGTSKNLDLLNGQIVPVGGQIAIECFSDIAQRKPSKEFDWSLKIIISGGGIQESHDEFNFVAPQDGYSQTYEFQMNSTKQDGWKNMVEKSFYVRLPDGNYGCFHINYIANNGVMRFDSRINPSGGSRNLEYDEAVQPKATVHE